MTYIVEAIGYLLALSILFSPSYLMYRLISENVYMGRWLININGGGFNWYALGDWVLFGAVFMVNVLIALLAFAMLLGIVERAKRCGA